MDSVSESTSSPSRRRVLAAVATVVGPSVAGCLEEDGDVTETETTTPTDTATETPTADPNVMSAGTSMVEIQVEAGFSKDVTVEAGCREDAIEVSPGGDAEIRRREDGEECSIRLVIDGETRYEATVFDYQTYRLTVDEDGSIEETVIAK